MLIQYSNPSKNPSEQDRDHDIMTNPHFLRLMLRSARESFAQGYDHVWEDGRLICKDFGFRVDDIRKDLPVQLRYGKFDTFVPIGHGEAIKARMGGNAELIVKEEGHAGIGVRYRREIVEGLLKRME